MENGRRLGTNFKSGFSAVCGGKGLCRLLEGGAPGVFDYRGVGAFSIIVEFVDFPSENAYTDPIEKGGDPIRYVYRPRHPWRHRYQRERAKSRLLWLFRLLAVLGAAGFAVCYIRRNTTEEIIRVQAEEGAKEAGKEVYGVGIEKGDGTIFWFHERIEESQ